MSVSALIMMSLTWIFISFFTIRFFIKVLKLPPSSDYNEE